MLRSDAQKVGNTAVTRKKPGTGPRGYKETLLLLMDRWEKEEEEVEDGWTDRGEAGPSLHWFQVVKLDWIFLVVTGLMGRRDGRSRPEFWYQGWDDGEPGAGSASTNPPVQDQYYQ